MNIKSLLNVNNYLLLLICLVGMWFSVVVGCSSIKDSTIPKKPSIIWESEEIETTFFPNINDIFFIEYCYDILLDKEYLLHYKDDASTILIFDFSTGEQISKFQLQNKAQSIYFHSLDSIFVYSKDAYGQKGTIILLLTSKGDLINFFQLNDYLVINENPNKDKTNKTSKLLVRPIDNPFLFRTFCYLDSTFYISVAPHIPIKERFHYPPMAIINLDVNIKNDTNFFFEYPAFYREEKIYKADYFDFDVYVDEFKIVNLFLSFPLSDTVGRYRFVPRFMANERIIFDSEEYDTLILKSIKSSYHSDNNYLVQSSNNDRFLFWGFKYTSIKFDSFRKVFYRVAHHLVDSEITSKLHSTEQDRKILEVADKYQNWSLLIADEKMDKVDEKLFEYEQRIYPNIIVTKEGIAFISKDIQKNPQGINIIKHKVTITKTEPLKK